MRVVLWLHHTTVMMDENHRFARRAHGDSALESASRGRIGSGWRWHSENSDCSTPTQRCSYGNQLFFERQAPPLFHG